MRQARGEACARRRPCGTGAAAPARERFRWARRRSGAPLHNVLEMRLAAEVADDIGPFARRGERDRAWPLTHREALDRRQRDPGRAREPLAERREQPSAKRALIRLAGHADEKAGWRYAVLNGHWAVLFGTPSPLAGEGWGEGSRPPGPSRPAARPLIRPFGPPSPAGGEGRGGQMSQAVLDLGSSSLPGRPSGGVTEFIGARQVSWLAAYRRRRLPGLGSSPVAREASARRSQSRGRPRIGQRPTVFPFHPLVRSRDRAGSCSSFARGCQIRRGGRLG